MSIESFHRSLHGTCNDEPLLANLRAITMIKDPAVILAASNETQDGSWAVWQEAPSDISGERP